MEEGNIFLGVGDVVLAWVEGNFFVQEYNFRPIKKFNNTSKYGGNELALKLR